MAKYTAWVTDPNSANEGVYTFEARDDLFDQTHDLVGFPRIEQREHAVVARDRPVQQPGRQR